MNTLKFLFIFLIIFSMQASATELLSCSKKSGPQTMALLELYTSEGCSSCPPADKFLNTLSDTTQLTQDQLIPLAMHVDYWDYIGWKDRFANALFTDRQRWLAARNNKREIYTPEFFLSGKELRVARANFVDAVHEINKQPARADIQLTIVSIKDNRIDLNISGKTLVAGKLFYGLVENNLSSQVKAGENKNSYLLHNSVVRVWGSPLSIASGDYKLSTYLNMPVDSIQENLSVVVFVQTDSGEVLQAVSLMMCK